MTSEKCDDLELDTDRTYNSFQSACEAYEAIALYLTHLERYCSL